MRVAGSPECAVYSSRPRSIGTVLLPRSRASEDRMSTGQPKVLLKSPPVPKGSTPSTAVGLIGFPPSKNPLTTSLSVPSPPAATMQPYPSLSARAVICVACIGPAVNSSPNSPSARRSSARVCSHLLPVWRFALRALTTTKVFIASTLRTRHAVGGAALLAAHLVQLTPQVAEEAAHRN